MVQSVPNHRPTGIRLSYDLGEHTLIIEDQKVTLAEKGDAETPVQELSLDGEEAYKLLVTLQMLFQ